MKETKKDVEKKLVGKIKHFFDKISVAVIELTDELKVGDEISIEGTETSLQQKVDSMQIEHKDIKKAEKGQDIGLKTKDKVKQNDSVYKILQ